MQHQSNTNHISSLDNFLASLGCVVTLMVTTFAMASQVPVCHKKLAGNLTPRPDPWGLAVVLEGKPPETVQKSGAIRTKQEWGGTLYYVLTT